MKALTSIMRQENKPWREKQFSLVKTIVSNPDLRISRLAYLHSFWGSHSGALAELCNVLQQ